MRNYGKGCIVEVDCRDDERGPARPILNPPLHCQWNTNRDLHTPYSRVLFFEWLSDSAKYSMTRSTRSLSATLTVEVIVICQLVTQQWKTTINRHFSVNITTNPRSWDYRFFNPEFGDWKTDPGLQLQRHCPTKWTSSTDRTSTSSQHLRSAGICCRWSDDV